jgi:hypothetical protein
MHQGTITHRLAGTLFAVMSLGAGAQVSIDPANPTPLDVVRLRYTHTGCTNPDSLKVSQVGNLIGVQVDRSFAVIDCGTILGFFEEFTLGRLPSGEYDAQLAINPPPGTLGPTLLLEVVHFTVAALPPTGSLRPHENYQDMWWSPRESGWSLNVFQSGDKLFVVWLAYEADGRATWFVMPSGAWSRNSGNILHFSGAVYRTQGPPWPGAFDPTAVSVMAAGTADFLPRSSTHAQFSYTIGNVSGVKELERFRF